MTKKIILSFTSNTKISLICDYLYISGIYLSAISTFLSTFLFNLGLILIFLAFILEYKKSFYILKKSISILCIINVLFILTIGFITSSKYPSLSKIIWEKSFDWVRLFTFFPLTLPMIRNRKHLYSVYLLSLISLLTSNVIAIGHEGIISFINGSRYGGLLGKPIANAFYCAVAILGIICWIPGLARIKYKKKITKYSLLLTSLILLLVFIFFLVISYSRGPLISLTITLFILDAYACIHLIITKKNFKNILALHSILLILILFFSTTSCYPFNRISNRLSLAYSNLKQIYSQGINNAKENNVSTRISMWHFGATEWLENPILGKGPGLTKSLISLSDNKKLYNSRGIPQDHLHNYYIMSLFSFGIVGFLLSSLVFTLIPCFLIKAYSLGNVNLSDFLFTMSTFLLISLYSITDFRHLNHDWRFFWTIFASCSYSLTLCQKDLHL